MRFFVVAVVAVLAGGADAGIITMSEDLSLGGGIGGVLGW